MNTELITECGIEEFIENDFNCYIGNICILKSSYKSNKSIIREINNIYFTIALKNYLLDRNTNLALIKDNLFELSFKAKKLGYQTLFKFIEEEKNRCSSDEFLLLNNAILEKFLNDTIINYVKE